MNTTTTTSAETATRRNDHWLTPAEFARVATADLVPGLSAFDAERLYTAGYADGQSEAENTEGAGDFDEGHAEGYDEGHTTALRHAAARLRCAVSEHRDDPDLPVRLLELARKIDPEGSMRDLAGAYDEGGNQ